VLAARIAPTIGEHLAPLPGHLRSAIADTFPAAPPEPVDHLIYQAPPAAGAGAVYTVNDQQAGARFVAAYCRLTTSAVVADRRVALELRGNDALPFVACGTPAVVAASSVGRFSWHYRAGAPAWPVAGAAIAPLPPLEAGMSVALTVDGIDAGDQLDQIRLVARY